MGHAARLVTAAILCAAALSGCSAAPDQAGTPGVLLPSSEYAQTVGPLRARQRSTDLGNAIAELRDATNSNWTGRQDDVSGYLTELSGGQFTVDDSSVPQAARDLLRAYARPLFGVNARDLKIGAVQQTAGLPVAALRVGQLHHGVPVRDGELSLSAKSAKEAATITSVRGRTFPGLTVGVRPKLSVDAAKQVILDAAPNATMGDGQLLVVPTGQGLLAWQIATSGADPNDPNGGGLDYFVNALTGQMIDVRPTTMSAVFGAADAPGTEGAFAYKLGPQDVPITVTGVDPQGRKVSAHALQTPAGIKLVDTTVNTYDPATGTGAVITYSADNTDRIPNRIFTQLGTDEVIRDPEAIGAHAFSRATHDYYRSMGWKSWDNQRSTMPAVIHFNGGRNYCNAFFRLNVMVYGEVCRDGEIMVDAETTGHEVTHGVTASSANLEYFGQPGALNESFSDYFGNIIGTGVSKRPNASFSEDSCINVKEPTPYCFETPDGMLASRYMLNGRKLSDVAGILTLPLRYYGESLADNDQGGVHLNSAIWNHALWSVREDLGDRKHGTKLVDTWDRIVFHALTTLVTSTDGFVDASRAVAQVAKDVGQPVIAKAAGKSFTWSGFCATCGADAKADGEPVASGGPTQIDPAVDGDRVAWLDSSYWFGTPTQAAGGKPRGMAIGTAGTVDFDFAGDALVSLEGSDTSAVVRQAPDGTRTVLESIPDIMVGAYAGVDGSREGAAWANQEAHSVSFVDASGRVTRTFIPPNLDTITSVSTGGGMVGIATASGTLLQWQPGGEPAVMSSSTGIVRSSATSGDLILTVDERGEVTLFNGSDAVHLDAKGVPLGAALSDKYAVWPTLSGRLQGGIADDFAKTQGRQLLDYDLRLYSLKTGKFYDFKQRGQQAFPALSGNRLAWQDAASGTDDIRTDVLPGDL